MTCEISMMNLHAIALAADSAMTVRMHCTETSIEHALNAHKTLVEAEAIRSIGLFNLTGLVDTSQLVALAVKTLFKDYIRFKSKTGVVVARYGDNDFFPGFCEYPCYGLMLDKLIYDPNQTRKN